MNYEYSVIIPVYNEIARLITGFLEITQYLKSDTAKWELIIVDDGSTVPTETVLLESHELSQTVKDLSKKGKLTILRLPRNSGKGKAIKEGINAARGRYCLFMDIDCSVTPSKIPEFIHAVKKTPVAIASRRIVGSTVLVHQDPVRELGGRIYTEVSNRLCNVNVHDATCGFKAFRTSVAKELFGKSIVNRWAFDTEILFLARKKGVAVKEIPVVWTHKKGSRVKGKDMVRSFFDLLSIRFHDLKGTYADTKK
jgi:dolichyl-phosphate beta-glucosyltransferase